jgi:hypothetical protein
MKPTKQGSSNFQNFPIGNRKKAKSRTFESEFLHPITSNLPMTEQLVAPPPRVWEKIEKVLDEQDRKKRSQEVVYCQSAKDFSKTKKSFPIYFAAAGATIIGSLVLLLR